MVQRSITDSYSSPTISDYGHLLQLYPDRVQCLCTQIAIPYSKFVTAFAVASFHQACSTNIIYQVFSVGLPIPSLAFMNQNINDLANWWFLFTDGLVQLCSLAKNTITNTIEVFLASEMLANQLIPRALFENDMNATLMSVKNVAPIAFTRTLNLIRMSIQSNALMATLGSNWNIGFTGNGRTMNGSFINIPVTHTDTDKNDTCSCATEISCSRPVQSVQNNPTPYTFDGLKFGCFLLETILTSSLSCFYSLACIRSYRNITNAMNNLEEWGRKHNIAVVFNASLTRFSINDTIETLTSQMFIESWTSNVSYELFFNSCAPISCSYTYYYRNDALEVFTTVLSVLSGLMLVLRFIAPRLIQIVERLRNRIHVAPSI